MHDPDFQDRDPLFDALRNEIGQLNTPRSVEDALLRAFAAQSPRKPRWYQRISLCDWTLVGSVFAGCAAVLLFTLTSTLPSPGTGLQPPRITQVAEPFIALESPERIAREMAPRLVTTTLARSSLTALGLQLTPDNAGDDVKAEMLVAADGQPLALRLSTVPDTRRIN